MYEIPDMKLSSSQIKTVLTMTKRLKGFNSKLKAF